MLLTTIPIMVMIITRYWRRFTLWKQPAVSGLCVRSDER
jgi:hypothetical protein